MHVQVSTCAGECECRRIGKCKVSASGGERECR